jgi:hypothetical protein
LHEAGSLASFSYQSQSAILYLNPTLIVRKDKLTERCRLLRS